MTRPRGPAERREAYQRLGRIARALRRRSELAGPEEAEALRALAEIPGRLLETVRDCADGAGPELRGVVLEAGLSVLDGLDCRDLLAAARQARAS